MGGAIQDLTNFGEIIKSVRNDLGMDKYIYA